MRSRIDTPAVRSSAGAAETTGGPGEEVEEVAGVEEDIEIYDRTSPELYQGTGRRHKGTGVGLYSRLGVTATTSPQPQLSQVDLNTTRGAGGWLFRHRTWLPLPLVAAIFLIPGSANAELTLWLLGAGCVFAGEALRLWAVQHIGVISRTRSDRLGPLISTGPFSLVRNPLYLGNIALWVGFAVSARLLYLAPLLILVVGLEYHAIVRWEEQLLAARFGDSYRAYAARVPRWVPALARAAHSPSPPAYSWRETFFSERGTLMAIAAGFALLWLKTQ